MDSSSRRSLCEKLRAVCRGEVWERLDERASLATDFGGMYRVVPMLVLRPLSVEDVQAALRVAAETNTTVSLRGAGHSQSGQGLGTGLLLDMTSLNRIVDFQPSDRSIEVEAGITWRAVVDASFAQRLLPVALTHAVDTTVGGTLSVGGIGSAGWSYGPQVDNISYLDVVTASGELIRCSLEQEPALFDAVRAGLGQCGVIVRAGLRLRPCGSRIVTRTFVYRELENLVGDVPKLTAELDRDRLIAVRVGRDPMRKGHLMAALFVGQDLTNDQPNPTPLPTLHSDFAPPVSDHSTWRADGQPGHPYFKVFGTNQPPTHGQRKNPWMDFFFPLPDALAALAALAAEPSGLLYRGPAEIIFVARGSNPAPLLVTPPVPMAMGLGVFPSFGPEDAADPVSVMSTYAGMMSRCGGRRYFCGYFAPSDVEDWTGRYGETWSRFAESKARLDPSFRFGSNLMRWRAE